MYIRNWELLNEQDLFSYYKRGSIEALREIFIRNFKKLVHINSQRFEYFEIKIICEIVKDAFVTVHILCDQFQDIDEYKSSLQYAVYLKAMKRPIA